MVVCMVPSDEFGSNVERAEARACFADVCAFPLDELIARRCANAGTTQGDVFTHSRRVLLPFGCLYGGYRTLASTSKSLLRQMEGAP